MPAPDLHHSLIDVVWLDLDDTLIDFRRCSRVALRRIYDEESLLRFFPTPGAWECAYEQVNYMLWQEYSRGDLPQERLRLERFLRPLIYAGVAYEIALKMSRRLDPIYLDIMAGAAELLPGATDLLISLRSAGLRIGILSNGFAEVQHRKLCVTGLEDKIDLMVLSDEIGVQKPDRRLFDHAMRRAGCSDPSRQLMIGDNANTDIAGALGAGWRALLVDKDLPLVMTTGKGYHIVSHLRAVPSILGLPLISIDNQQA